MSDEGNWDRRFVSGEGGFGVIAGTLRRSHSHVLAKLSEPSLRFLSVAVYRAPVMGIIDIVF